MNKIQGLDIENFKAQGLGDTVETLTYDSKELSIQSLAEKINEIVDQSNRQNEAILELASRAENGEGFGYNLVGIVEDILQIKEDNND